MAEYTGQSFVRKRHVIRMDNGAVFKSCASISEAKRLSREIQLLGGKMTVDRSDDPKPAPKRDKGDAADRFIARKTRELREQRLAEKRAEKTGPNTITLKKQA